VAHRYGFTPVTSTIRQAMLDSAEIASSLKTELDEWMRVMPMNLRDGQKAMLIESSIASLEEVSESWLNDHKSYQPIYDLPVTYKRYTRRVRMSRRLRNHEAILRLEAVSATLTQKIPGNPETKAAVDEIVTEVDEMVQALKAVVFPGMYGLHKDDE
jgi:hypothetical protein